MPIQSNKLYNSIKIESNTEYTYAIYQITLSLLPPDFIRPLIDSILFLRYISIGWIIYISNTFIQNSRLLITMIEAMSFSYTLVTR